MIKLPAHSTNGSILSAPPTYTTSNASNTNDSDAPLNLSLKPASTSNNSPTAGSQPLTQLSNLSQSLLASDRTCKSKIQQSFHYDRVSFSCFAFIEKKLRFQIPNLDMHHVLFAT